MQIYSVLILTCGLAVFYSPVWGERNTEQPTSFQSEPQTEQSERHRSPENSDRDIEIIRLNQQLNRKGSAVSQPTSVIKSPHNTDQSIINNLR